MQRNNINHLFRERRRKNWMKNKKLPKGLKLKSKKVRNLIILISKIVRIPLPNWKISKIRK